MEYVETVEDEGLYAVRYVEGTPWEVINHLGEIRMILHSFGAETDSRPVLIFNDIDSLRKDFFKAFVGFRVRAEYARGVLLHIRLPSGIYFRSSITGGPEVIAEAVKGLVDEVRSQGMRAESAHVVFNVNPLDYPYKLWSSELYVSAAKGER